MKNSCKAFTLTELLIVVVIIGVLSAVVLPKFSKILEARRTMEAEAMMTAVRNEQEARCVLGKNYTDLSKLGVSKNLAQTNHFTYGNNDAQVGVVAQALRGDYQLEIPSYVDGRICCSGKGCADLGKNYPSCDDLVFHTTDYVKPNAGCAVRAVAPTCPYDYENGQTKDVECYDNSGNKGHRIDTWSVANCDWMRGTCVVEPITELCDVPQQTTQTEHCGCEDTGTRTKTFDEKHCMWGEWGECEGEDTSKCEKTKCDPEEQKACNGENEFWNYDICTCIQCESSKNMRLNDTRDGCICTTDITACADKGEVYWDNATKAMFSKGPSDNFRKGEPECGCKPCEDFKGLDEYKEQLWFANGDTKSSDGTVGTCTNCFYTETDCKDGTNGAPQGTVLKITDALTGACDCVSCSEYSTVFGDQALSTTGYGKDCRNCVIEKDSCTGDTHFVWTDAQGNVLENQASFNTTSYCACKTCAEITGEENSFWSEKQKKCKSCAEGKTWNDEIEKCIRCNKTPGDCKKGEHFALYLNGFGPYTNSWYEKAYKEGNWNIFLEQFADYVCTCKTCAEMTGDEKAYWSESKGECVVCKEDETWNEKFEKCVAKCSEDAPWNDEIGKCVRCKKTPGDCKGDEHFALYLNGFGPYTGSEYEKAYKEGNWNIFLKQFADYVCTCKTCAEMTGDETAHWSESEEKCIAKCKEDETWNEKFEKCVAKCSEDAPWNDEIGKCVRCKKTPGDCKGDKHFALYTKDGYGPYTDSWYEKAYKEGNWNIFLETHADYVCTCKTCKEMGYSEKASWDSDTASCRECFPAPKCSGNTVLQNAGTKDCACVECPVGKTAQNGTCGCATNNCATTGQKQDSITCACVDCPTNYTSKDGETCQPLLCQKTAEGCRDNKYGDGPGRILTNEDSYLCSCEACSKENYTTKDGKTCGCYKDAKNDCAYQNGTFVGKVLNKPSCSCMSCFEAHNKDAAYEGVLSTDGVNCTPRGGCKISKETCARDGNVLVDWGKYSYDNCTCLSCQAAGALKNMTFSKKATSHDGTLTGPQGCRECWRTQDDCTKEKKKLVTNSDGTCSCKTCYEMDPKKYNKDFIYTQEDGCKCGLTTEFCKSQDGQFLRSYEQGFQFYDCECQSCAAAGYDENTRSSEGTVGTCNNCGTEQPKQ